MILALWLVFSWRLAGVLLLKAGEPAIIPEKLA